MPQTARVCYLILSLFFSALTGFFISLDSCFTAFIAAGLAFLASLMFLCGLTAVGKGRL